VKLRLKPWVNMEPRSSKADESAIARPPPGGPSAIANTPNTTRLVQLLLDDRLDFTKSNPGQATN
jgi:hypothetical protein